MNQTLYEEEIDRLNVNIIKYLFFYWNKIVSALTNRYINLIIRKCF